MKVTDEHLNQYRDEGYCLIRGLIPGELLEAVNRRTLEIVNDPPAWSTKHFQVLDPGCYRSPNGGAIPGGIQRPAEMEEVYRRVADDPDFAGAMSRLLGGEVERFTDQVGVKHGIVTEEQGGRSFYHQDSFYWHIDPELGCNAWLPTSSVDRDAIALAVMPKSHRNWELEDHESYLDDPPMGSMRDEFKPFKRHRIPGHRIDASKEVLVPMEPGDALFFTNYTWHRSEPNRTGESKSFYAIAYQRSGRRG